MHPADPTEVVADSRNPALCDPLTNPRFRLASPTIGEAEVEAVREVLFSGRLTNGPATERFEANFAKRHDCEFGVALANGTVALSAIYLALGIGDGDEVIVPSLTFISTATSVLHVGARPVFADVQCGTFNLDPRDVVNCLSSATKAIVAVHYGGQSADMAELRALADEAGVFLIEDAAEAHGASYQGRSVGSLGDAAIFSFTPTKNITMGEGGIVTTSNGDVAERIRLLRNHGQSAPYVHGSLGYNWRMTEMQAAIGDVQLRRLDSLVATKQMHARWMESRLSECTRIKTPYVKPDRDHVYMLYTLVVDERRDDLLRALKEHGIEARVYFPPAHRQPIFPPATRELPKTDWLADHLLSVPFHARLSIDDLSEIVDELEESLDKGLNAGA